MGIDVKQFVKDRNKAFTAFVMNDDWNAIKDYCTSYGMAMPDNPDVMAASVYKAVQEVTNIPDEVKIEAAMKCMKLGFTPFMFMRPPFSEEG